ncbi:hypothetical protein HJA82_28955 [Rhizobium bangladeshense]|uniref:hypothetical protein n=1 Tax=Rhizobium TaxID=379 RepID=UPI001C82CAE2|nr:MULTISPECIES: hypothetical protein [Rhizobium]MBX4911343.1 hypothetical protein [Rhizobium bangladeshense]MBX5130803.1 hypothetical protein [Rhizobium lentis]
MTFVRPKFDDCKSCVFFLRNRVNPVCKQCDSGEFYEQKIRTREKTNHELMELYGEHYDGE